MVGSFVCCSERENNLPQEEDSPNQSGHQDTGLSDEGEGRCAASETAFGPSVVEGVCVVALVTICLRGVMGKSIPLPEGEGGGCEEPHNLHVCPCWNEGDLTVAFYPVKSSPSQTSCTVDGYGSQAQG